MTLTLTLTLKQITTSIGIKSFGFKTHSATNSGHNDDIILTLWWNKQILQCIIPESSNGYDTYFKCNDTNINVLQNGGLNKEEEEYKMKIYYTHSSLVRISEIMVIDLDDNYYAINTFCGALQFYYWDSDTIDNKTKCMDHFTTKYNYSYIELATNTAFLTTIYINFISNILNYPNMYLSGELLPENIARFDLKHVLI